MNTAKKAFVMDGISRDMFKTSMRSNVYSTAISAQSRLVNKDTSSCMFKGYTIGVMSKQKMASSINRRINRGKMVD